MSQIRRHFSDVDEAMTLADQNEIEKAVAILQTARDLGSSVWICGNGGSASTAAHFANDLAKMARIKAHAVPEMTSTTLAYGNDDGWENMFSHTAELYVSRNDVLIGISCSGNSSNVLEFMKLPARFRIGMTGPNKNALSVLKPDALIRGMSDEITVMEDLHLMVCHAIARALCRD